jgi:hypothetical protein
MTGKEVTMSRKRMVLLIVIVSEYRLCRGSLGRFCIFSIGWRSWEQLAELELEIQLYCQRRVQVIRFCAASTM